MGMLLILTQYVIVDASQYMLSSCIETAAETAILINVQSFAACIDSEAAVASHVHCTQPSHTQ